jgi:hypothetical protein
LPPNCAPSSELPACNRPTCWSDTRWAVSISTSSPASPPYPKFNNHPKLAAGEALVFAYRAYQAATLPPYRISLDRAFNLVSYIDGIWLASAPALSVLTCPGCGCEFIAAVGTVAHPGEPCPFCKLLERFHLDHRIQASYPARPALCMTERQLGMLALFHKLSPEAEGPNAHRTRSPVPTLTGARCWLQAAP